MKYLILMGICFLSEACLGQSNVYAPSTNGTPGYLLVASPNFSGTVTTPTAAIATETVGAATFTNVPTFPNQPSNTFLAGPVNNGASAAPTIRLLDKSDLAAAQLMQAGETNLTSASTVIVQYKINMADTNYNIHLTGDNVTLAAPAITAQTVSNFSASMTSFTGGLNWTIIRRTQ